MSPIPSDSSLAWNTVAWLTPKADFKTAEGACKIKTAPDEKLRGGGIKDQNYPSPKVTIFHPL